MGCLNSKQATPIAVDAHDGKHFQQGKSGTRRPASGVVQPDTVGQGLYNGNHPGRHRGSHQSRNAPGSSGHSGSTGRLPAHHPMGDSAEDGDWDNCETVFNLDEVDASELIHADSQEQPEDTQGSSVVDRAFQNSLLASKSSIGQDEGPQLQPYRSVRETSLLRIEKVKGCMFVNQYLVVKYLGRGACGKVFLCLNVEDWKLYAMKAVRKSDLQTSRNQANKRNPMDDLKREIMIMKKMKHLNIVTLTEVIDDPSGSKLLLVMEYLEGGPVMTREALERCERLSEQLVAKYFRDMVRALDYLHSQRVVHGDLKPENVLVSATGTVKLSDFGCSKVIVSGNEYLERCNGTPAFLAPEMMRPNSRYRGRPTDIYAMGACLYTLVYGRIPFTAPNLYQLFQVVQNENVAFPENVPISEPLKDLLQRLLTKNPKERITLYEIKHHKWVTGCGRYPVPRWSDNPNLDAKRDELNHNYHEIITALAAHSIREQTFSKGEVLLRQGDTGSFMLYIEQGACEVRLRCAMPVRRNIRGHSSNRKARGSADSGDPLMNSSDSASSVALTEEDRQARQNLVVAADRAAKYIRKLDRGQNELLVADREAGDVVGEMALFTREPARTATVVAKTKTVVKVMMKEDVLSYFARFPEARQHLREIMWSRDGESIRIEGLYQLGKVHEILVNSWGVR